MISDRFFMNDVKMNMVLRSEKVGWIGHGAERRFFGRCAQIERQIGLALFDNFIEIDLEEIKQFASL